MDVLRPRSGWSVMDTAAAVNVESMLELIEDISDETPENKLLLVKQK